TRIDLVAHYDNSSANKHNPDSTKVVRFGEASTAEMMFGMFEYTAASGVSPKATTERSRMETLTETMPADSTFVVDIPFTSQTTTAVISMPKSGEATFYMPVLGLILPHSITDIEWRGNIFIGQLVLQVPGPAGGFYTISGR